MNHVPKKHDVDPQTSAEITRSSEATGENANQQSLLMLVRGTILGLKQKQKSLGYAAAVLAVLVVWMASGIIGQSTTISTPVAPLGSADNIATVAIRDFKADGVTRFITSPAEVKPERVIPLRAQAEGRVRALPVAMGSRVQAGTPIVQIEMGDRAARLQGALAELEQRERDNAATEDLAAQGFATKARVREVFTALQAARANVKEIEEEVSNTSIKSSFGGVLDNLNVEVGEFVSVGTEVAKIVDNNPLIIEAQVAQQNVKLLKTGLTADVSFITGQDRRGTIRYISVQADPGTRTFRVEIEVDNADGAIPSGTSAKVNIPVGDVAAHFVSPAIFSLDTDGTLGVKSVDENNVVQFYAVDVVRAESDGVWITGLPEQIRLITKGQGFVAAGERVRPSDVGSLDAEAPRQSL